MDKQHFIHLIKSPGAIEETYSGSLKQLIKDYPYFHSAYLLFIKNTKETNADNFEQVLHDYSVKVADRKILFNLVQNANVNTPDNNNLENNKSISELLVEEEKLVEENATIYSNKEIENKEDTVELPPSLVDIEESFDIIEDEEEKARIIEFEVVPSEINDNSNSSRDIIDNFLTFLEAPANEEIIEVTDQSSLIDKFITEDPVFKPKKIDLSDQQEDISVNSISEDDELVSETLAHVFESQKLYDKAINVYEKLILKFPEKSTYFASRIEEIRINLNN